MKQLQISADSPANSADPIPNPKPNTDNTLNTETFKPYITEN